MTIIVVLQSIEKAHNDMAPGRMYVSSGELLDTSINRSPTSYLNNPEKEREKYQHNTDKLMTVVKFVGEDGSDRGKYFIFYIVKMMCVVFDTKCIMPELCESNLRVIGVLISGHG